MATSIYNPGTEVGTWITGDAVTTSLGTLALPVVGVSAGLLVFLPLGRLALVERRRQQRLSATLGNAR